MQCIRLHTNLQTLNALFKFELAKQCKTAARPVFDCRVSLRHTRPGRGIETITSFITDYSIKNIYSKYEVTSTQTRGRLTVAPLQAADPAPASQC